MDNLEFFTGERVISEDKWKSGNEDFEITCTSVARWEFNKGRTVECGNDRDVKLIRKVGITQTQKENLESSIKVGLEAKGIAKFAAEFKAKIGYEIKYEESIIEEESFRIKAPECGRKLLSIYQLVKEHRFIIEDRRFFLFNKGTQYIPITEYTDSFWDRSPVERNIPECDCGDMEDNVDGVWSLRIGSMGILSLVEKVKDGIYIDALNIAVPDNQIGSLLIDGYKLSADSLPDYVRFLGSLKREDVTMRLTSTIRKPHENFCAFPSKLNILDLAKGIAIEKISFSDPNHNLEDQIDKIELLGSFEQEDKET